MATDEMIGELCKSIDVLCDILRDNLEKQNKILEQQERKLSSISGILSTMCNQMP
jgi:hypothetical protein